VEWGGEREHQKEITGSMSPPRRVAIFHLGLKEPFWEMKERVCVCVGEVVVRWQASEVLVGKKSGFLTRESRRKRPPGLQLSNRACPIGPRSRQRVESQIFSGHARVKPEHSILRGKERQGQAYRQLVDVHPHDMIQDLVNDVVRELVLLGLRSLCLRGRRC